jgi:hypothetical protein
MFPDFVSFWELVLRPSFLIPAGLVVLAFGPLLLSVWTTWQTNDVKVTSADHH